MEIIVAAVCSFVINVTERLQVIQESEYRILFFCEEDVSMFQRLFLLVQEVWCSFEEKGKVLLYVEEMIIANNIMHMCY